MTRLLEIKGKQQIAYLRYSRIYHLKIFKQKTICAFRFGLYQTGTPLIHELNVKIL